MKRSRRKLRRRSSRNGLTPPWVQAFSNEQNWLCPEFEPGQVGKMRNSLLGLYRAFHEKDCLLAEINPLVLTRRGDFIALDAKMNFDDNGLFAIKRSLR